MASPADAALIAKAREATLGVLLASCGEKHSPEGKPWREVLRKDALHLTVFDADMPHGGMRRFKGICELRGYSPARVQKCLQDLEARLKWDDNMLRLDVTVLQEAPERAILLHSVTKAVGPISSRSFLDCTVFLAVDSEEGFGPSGPDGYKPPKGTLLSGGVGVETDARYPEDKSWVRGINDPGCGWVFEPIRDASGAVTGTRVIYCILTHLRGWLPNAVVNSSLANSYVAFYGGLAKALADGIGA